MGKRSKRERKGTYVREWRDKLRLSQEDLAAEAGVSQETISRLERGKIDYTQATLEAVASALGCSEGQLLDGPPKPVGELEKILNALSPETRRRATIVIKALKDSEDEEAA